jgi:hypothetical protein
MGYFYCSAKRGIVRGNRIFVIVYKFACATQIHLPLEILLPNTREHFVRGERSLAILAKGLPHNLGSSEIIFRRRLRPIFTAFARLLFLSLLSTSHFHHNVSRTQQACHAWRRRSGDRLSVVPFLSSREAVVGFSYRNRLFHLLYS